MGNPVQWLIAEGNTDAKRLTQLTGSASPPDGSFAIIPFPSSGGSGALTSDPILCQRGSGFLSFKYWLSDGVKIEVCAVNDKEDLFCEKFAEGRGSAQPLVTFTGSILDPFRIVIRASADREGFAIVDNINYIANLCSTGATPSRSTSRPRPPHTLRPPTNNFDPIDKDTCQHLSCNFEEGTMCQLSTPLIKGSTSVFEVKAEMLGIADNVMAGSDNGNFLGTMLSPRGQYAVVETPQFSLSRPQLLRFNYHRGTYGSELWVCLNRLSLQLPAPGCSLVAGPGLTLADWKTARTAAIPLGVSDHKVFLVAKHEEFQYGSAAFAIDNMKLVGASGNDLC